MSTTGKNIGLIVLGAVIGAAGFGAVMNGTRLSTIVGIDSGADLKPAQAPKASNEPLYWVAPMDPNYQRDKPGKSPMGMDLVPVYEEAGSAADSGPGTIKVSPEVVNNLGVRTAMALRTSMNFEVRTVGYVDYNQDEIAQVHPRVEGWIEKIYVKAEGEPVEKGGPLYELYSPALVNAQEEYLFALSRGNRDLIRGAKTRLSALQVPQRTLEELRKTRKVQQAVIFYAPHSGVVDNFNIRQGMFVKPGMTLMSIGALDEVWVEAEVFERQASMITAGLPVSIQLDFLPGEDREGVVDYVYPVLDPVTRTLKVRMRFDNKDRQLKPNMFAEVVIYKEDTEASLTVPKDAVIRGAGSNRVVLALGDGRFKSIEVKTGRSDGNLIEILHGVNAGEEVVTSAQFLLDSESSKTSDFKRMHVEQQGNADDMSMDALDMESLDMDGMDMDSLDMESMDMDSMSLDGADSEMKQGEKVDL
ncbi:efflux RND transporter periplasmic adaptor subunit [Neptunomonas qingdaonensis]|uniref:Membrane fusion protein, Cu(I)/Ag(I) efflux system n=1 Tax=Neptunomonas qingdaonensis TaxID=1045558 RepID=A0A1I2SJG0_9GAMM|nr:efflux RND transporter periplasmic adaptor subunit [Neptunomonas qingdaonensis]SFG52870.1 membrane fusion protein, Cu(I)/Ag(I) efflux system [Neptunomonas qingdaonensis]